VVFVLVTATVGKVLGCGLGALFSKMPSREAWAIGFGMNARGAMIIILGLMALEKHVINSTLFVAMVVMAVVTSMMSGSVMERILKRKKSVRFASFLNSKTFVARMQSTERQDAILELSKAIGGATGLEPENIRQAVWERERLMSTGLPNGVCIPHARLGVVNHPLIAVGLSRSGIDFNSRDGAPARLLFLVLTPSNDNGAQLQILADIARAFGDAATVERAVQSNSFTEFLAVVRSESGEERAG